MPAKTAQPAEHSANPHPPDHYRGIYNQSYNEIVNPGRVWTATKYFLRRWPAYLAPAEIWLVIGARQLSYLNRRRPWFTAYDTALAQAAGLNVDVLRRTVKRDIVQGEGFIAHFLSKDRDPAYVVRGDVPRKGQTRYTIQLDDPLTPADAAAFAIWLRRQAPADADAAQITTALRQARQLEPQALWADELRPGHESEQGLPLVVTDLVQHLYPQLEDDETECEWRAAAEALHTHLVAGEIVHLEPQYFREKWLPALGPGPALLMVTLRSLCYFNEETGEVRDVVNTEARELAQRLQTTRRTLRRWFKKLEKAAAHDTLFGPFFRFLENSKQPDQTVISTYRVNLKMPLTPDDFGQYQARLAGAAAVKNGVADKKSVTNGDRQRRDRQKVPDKKSSTEASHAGVADKKSATRAWVTDKTTGTGEGNGQTVGNAKGGSGQNVAASRTKGRPFKHYERLLTVLKLEKLEQLEQSTEQQHQPMWRMNDGLAEKSLAAVAADSSAALLDGLGIHEPARGRILESDVSREELVAWHLYAARQSNLEQPTAYVVARALAGDRPPQPFLDLANMSWQQWRSYALVAYLSSQRLLDLDSAGMAFLRSADFQLWAELYGGTSPEHLPFGVGRGLVGFRIVGVGGSGDGAADWSGEPASNPGVAPMTDGSEEAAGEASDLWQDALAELSNQMAKATFEAWLHDSRFVKREGEVWIIAVSTPAAREWLHNRLRRVIEQTLSMVVGERCEVRFVVGADRG